MNLFVDDARKAYKFLSVQLAALLATLATAWEFVPAMQQYLDPAWVKYFALAMILARVIRQTPKAPAAPTDAGTP